MIALGGGLLGILLVGCVLTPFFRQVSSSTVCSVVFTNLDFLPFRGFTDL